MATGKTNAISGGIQFQMVSGTAAATSGTNNTSTFSVDLDNILMVAVGGGGGEPGNTWFRLSVEDEWTKSATKGFLASSGTCCHYISSIDGGVVRYVSFQSNYNTTQPVGIKWWAIGY